VDFSAPDFERYPGFHAALAAGQVAELEPGDALFYPAMWWHHVEALDSFNAMINYWWTTSPEFMDSPETTLLHALLSLRDRPGHEKQAWQALFDYYVFGAASGAGEHLPERVRGNLGPMDESRARRLRSQVQSRLNR
jgi:Cupin-like domain